MKTREKGKVRIAAICLSLCIPVTAIAAVWYDNEFHASELMTVGTSNWSGFSYSSSMAVGDFNVISAYRSMAIGSDILTVTNDSLVVGSYNDTNATARFVVANGEYVPGVGASRSNAFEIYDNGDALFKRDDGTGNTLEVRGDGDIIIPAPQGDVPMGVYTQ